jgi:hypothetical protein
MPSQSINFANITYLIANGSSYNRINRPGAIRMWERVWVSQGYTQWVYQGYTVDPPPYTLYGRKTGWWDTSGGEQAAQAFGVYNAWAMQDPFFLPSPGWPSTYEGWLVVQYYAGYPDLWQWYYDSPITVNVDPGPYWVDTSYSYWVDTSYWAYYY